MAEKIKTQITLWCCLFQLKRVKDGLKLPILFNATLIFNKKNKEMTECCCEMLRQSANNA